MKVERALLAEYAATGSEGAFREVVARYFDLVYSSAVRLVNGDKHLAEDVSQVVFADLARLAGGLDPGVMLGGWLHRRTCHVALTMMRSRRRREHRERQAVQMSALHDHDEETLRQVVPLLDEAIDQLGSQDRVAILLRFFERRDFRAIGVALGSNEDAAQKRVTRALEKLRSRLARRGVTASAAGLCGALGAIAVTAAPAGLAASVSSAALASAAASGGMSFALLKLFIMTKLKAVVGAVVVAGLGTALVIEHQSLTKVREQNQTLLKQVQQTTRASLLAARILPKPHLPAPPLASVTAVAPLQSEPFSAAELLLQSFKAPGSYKLKPEQLDAFLSENRRNAQCLLTAFRVSRDPSFLQEAIEKHPNDPRVNFAACLEALSRPGSTPDERRQRLDAFKQSAPDNALAHYLSAREHFISGQTDQAVQDLMAACGKSRFQDYSADFAQGAEEAYRAAGRSESEAKVIAGSTLDLPHLAWLKQLGDNLSELSGLYQQGGDAASALSTARIGLDLAQQLGDMAGGRGLIHDWVALAIEKRVLQSIDPATPYDVAGRTIQNRLDELAQRRAELKWLGDPATWDGPEPRHVMLELSQKMTPWDLVNFFDRMKVSGEMEALRWALEKFGTP